MPRIARSRQASRTMPPVTRWLLGSSLAASILMCPGVASAQFYIGPSYLFVPGSAGDAQEPSHRHWIRAESRYWTEHPVLPEIRGISAQKNDLLFTGPTAPPRGANVLTLSIDKGSSALKSLMDRCRNGERIAEVRFAESSELVRHPQEHGPRPSDVPEFYEYVLTGARLSCPEVAGAPEQAIQVRFEDIHWVNYQPQAAPRPVTATAARLRPLPRAGATKIFAVSWFAAAVDSADNQCERMNTKPAQADYFALMPQERAASLRSELASKGVGPDRMSYRGPNEMDVALLPGIVADPGHVAPHADVVQGFDLDGDNGAGSPPPGIRKHKNFISPDGRRGIDNQLFTVEGCVEGLRRKGFLPMIFNEGRAAGRPTALVEISGIDDDRNDPDVWVTVLYSADEMKRSPAKVVLADFTYRVSDNPEYTQDFARFHGRIVDGVVMTDPIDQLHIHEVTGIETTFIRPRLRLEIQPDGRLKGVVGGYVDWRKRLVFEIFRASDYENTVGFQIPAIYNAMKRGADGLQDPITHEFNGISAAFEIEGVPAFIPPGQQSTLLAQGSADPAGKARDR